MQFWKPFLLLLASSLCLAQSAVDRLKNPVDSGQLVALKGNVHGMARPEFDQGRLDGGKRLLGVSLVFKPSPAQQIALNNLLVQQQDPSSPNYHKWLTPAEFADRFGMSRNDIEKVVSWLASEGFAVTHVANSRNMVSFAGTVAQVESTFHTELHNYLVNGEMHFANSTEPLLPVAFAGAVRAVRNLHNFQPRPRTSIRPLPDVEANPHFTSHVSGKHFLAPGDFATIYDLQGLYSANIDGTGQEIVVVGQSGINLTDVQNFRNAAGLVAKNPTLLLEPGTGTSTICAGDEGESDLDVEWSGGVAKNASITLVYVGLASGDTCTGNRQFGAFDALQYAIDQNIAPIISSSYGLCENTNASVGITRSDALSIQGWAQQANTQGITIAASSGDDGAADCDFQVKSASHGFAVDIPAAIPEVTGVGGTEFNGDADATPVTGTPPNTNAPPTQYWTGTANAVDSISSAISYIPEMAWNDSTADISMGGTISASGGGASIYFSKPSWQTGNGVPSDGKRDVPDIALNASADHDGYLVCSEDGQKGTKVATCTTGFRDASGNLDVIGGTSAGAPTFAGILALLNQYFGNIPPGGLGNVNPFLYQFFASDPTAFNDVPPGSDNKVPCTAGSKDCPSSGSLGFPTGTGFDQVTGLGSVKAFHLAQAWAATRTASAIALSASATQLILGQSVTFTATVSPAVSGSVNFYNGTALLGTGILNGGVATFSTKALPAGTDSATARYDGSGSVNTSTSPAVSVTVIPPAFTLKSNVSAISVADGSSGTATLTVAAGNNFPQSISFSCSGLPSESQCMFSPLSVTPNGATVTDTLTITTVAPTAQLHPPVGGHAGTIYALLLPGLLGLCLTAPGKGACRMRLLSLILFLSCSTLWLGACGGSNSSNGNTGTPKGTSTVTVSATTGGTGAVTQTVQITLTVN